MPILYVHGVNTRKTDPGYETAVASRHELLRRRVLRPLASGDPRFAHMEIIDLYWGDLGARFAWNLASLPDEGWLESFGAEDAARLDADLAFRDSVQAMADDGDAPLEGAEGDFRKAAQADLVQFVELILLPLLLEDATLLAADALPKEEAQARALLAIACADTGADREVHEALPQMSSDAELMAFLEDKVLTRIMAMAQTEPGASDPDVEGLGAEDILGDVIDGARELFRRADDAYARVLSVAVVKAKRQELHIAACRFLGDVFVYLNGRGERDAKGPIVARVSQCLAAAAKPGEPTIVITHSMGGNILYDIVSHYAPEIRIDVWISVGGQVAQFEEMKLFKASNDAIRAPQKASGIKPAVAYWANIYDPLDILSFRTKPVFADADADLAYRTGASVFKSHVEYFGRASFYDLVRTQIEKGLQATA